MMDQNDQMNVGLEDDAKNEIPMKCRKCRFVLLTHPQVRVKDSHGNGHRFDFENSEPIAAQPHDNEMGLGRSCKSDVWYISEDCMPDWIAKYVAKGEWLKGKLKCPKCEARIGSYNFVSGLRCSCKSEIVAPVHIVKSKVDFTTAPHVPKVPGPGGCQSGQSQEQDRPELLLECP